MEVKRDILWRVYLCFIAVIAICVVILVKAFTIQQVEGKYWQSMSDSLHQQIQEVAAERGTIYSADGQMLSTGIPRFDVYVDFSADGLRENNGKLFYDNLDSLSWYLADLFKDKSKAQYKQDLKAGYKSKKRYVPFKMKVSYNDYKQMMEFPLLRLGKYKSGFIADVKSIRLTPYNLLAFRTIGLERENAQKVGLEATYDTILKGTEGKRLVRFIAGNTPVPVNDDNEVEPENGKDIVTTIDTRIQEITENALMKMMIENEAVHGCAIVMETKTGAVKAIANLGGRTPNGDYSEDLNYALMPSEPGSTFKLATMLSVLEDKKYSITNSVNLEGGTWKINGRTVYDSEEHGVQDCSVKRAFELSSNVGMAKLAYNSYSGNPKQFIQHLKNLGFDSTTGIDIYGERKPVMYQPGSRYWSATTLPWMAFGYNIAVTPMHTAMLYNAVANNGVMMKPYLLQAVMQDGNLVSETKPVIANEKICSDATLQQLKECLRGVCKDSGSTAFALFKNFPIAVAGKTGTALVAEGPQGYDAHIYQSSFAGFFPANNPQYTCVVVIKNKPYSKKIYGAAVAGPVFKEIAARLYPFCKQAHTTIAKAGKDSSHYAFIATQSDARNIFKTIGVAYKDSSKSADEFVTVIKNTEKPVIKSFAANKGMPQLKGMNLKDAVDACETLGLQVSIKGKGKVATQSIVAGQPIAKGQLVDLFLN
ncbi:MAG TPA: penicillin-binding protein [Chitinophagaceae bacterium]|nr:penicillin-binding protein [Chitinophagaceae bacterium]